MMMMIRENLEELPRIQHFSFGCDLFFSDALVHMFPLCRPQVSEKLGKVYSEMIFVHGFVHCDPHPGNVLIQKCPNSTKTQIVLLDHGLYQVGTFTAFFHCAVFKQLSGTFSLSVHAGFIFIPCSQIQACVCWLSARLIQEQVLVSPLRSFNLSSGWTTAGCGKH